MGNLLLDRTTAAVLQIDLGVAFEQGMFLNTPELVRGRGRGKEVLGLAGLGGRTKGCAAACPSLHAPHRARHTQRQV